MGRELTDEEAANLGLSKPAKRELSDEEAMQLGLSGNPQGSAQRAPTRLGNALRRRGVKTREIKTGPAAPNDPIETKEEEKDFWPLGLDPVVAGAGEGSTGGFIDEALGAVGAVQNLGENALRRLGLMAPETTPEGESKEPTPLLTSALDAYRKERDSTRGYLARQEKESPLAYGAGRIGGTVLSTTAIPGSGTLAGALGLGGLQGFGTSEADLTRNEAGRAAADIALGAGAGLAGYGAGKAIGAGVNKASQLFGRKAAKAATELAEREAAKQAGKEASALGGYRSAVQSASRDLEVLEREAASNLPGAERARELLASEKGQKLREMVLGSKLKTAPGRMGEMAEKLAEYEELVAGRDQSIANALDTARNSVWSSQVKPRFATLGHRLLPLATAGMGGLLGGTEGALAGGGVGGALALLQGRPGIVLRNLVRSPEVREKAFGNMALELGALGESLPELGGTAARLLWTDIEDAKRQALIDALKSGQ